MTLVELVVMGVFVGRTGLPLYILQCSEVPFSLLHEFFEGICKALLQGVNMTCNMVCRELVFFLLQPGLRCPECYEEQRQAQALSQAAAEQGRRRGVLYILIIQLLWAFLGLQYKSDMRKDGSSHKWGDPNMGPGKILGTPQKGIPKPYIPPMKPL